MRRQKRAMPTQRVHYGGGSYPDNSCISARTRTSRRSYGKGAGTWRGSGRGYGVHRTASNGGQHGHERGFARERGAGAVRYKCGLTRLVVCRQLRPRSRQLLSLVGGCDGRARAQASNYYTEFVKQTAAPTPSCLTLGLCRQGFRFNDLDLGTVGAGCRAILVHRPVHNDAYQRPSRSRWRSPTPLAAV